MNRNTVASPRAFTSEELKALLSDRMKGSAFSVEQYIMEGKVVCHGKYYDYKLSSGGNEISIHPKWNQSWFIGVVVCAVLGLFFIVPFIGVLVIAFIGNSEYSEFKRILKDSLYNENRTQSTTNDANVDPLEQLQKLADLKDKNLISEEDYQAKKTTLLEKIK